MRKTRESENDEMSSPNNRCEKCLMPTSAPGIILDDRGICGVCSAYRKEESLGDAALEHEIRRDTSAQQSFDCIVPLSGGLDSFYAAYYLVRRMRLRCLGVNYDHGFGSDTNTKVLAWIESTLDIPIVRWEWSKQATAGLIAAGIRTLLPFGPRYLQAAFCRQCGYGIRAAVYSEMMSRELPCVWGIHTMDEIPFRYCLDLSLAKQVFQSKGIHALRSLWFRYKQIRSVPSPGNSLLNLLRSQHGYPILPESKEGVNEFRFYDYVSWDRGRMLKELHADGIDVQPLVEAHADCRLAPVVDHVLRRAWSLGKQEVYVCNRLRAGQLERQEAERMIAKLGEEELDESVLREIGLSEKEITLILGVD
jgi:hypothetical protein